MTRQVARDVAAVTQSRSSGWWRSPQRGVGRTALLVFAAAWWVACAPAESAGGGTGGDHSPSTGGATSGGAPGTGGGISRSGGSSGGGRSGAGGSGTGGAGAGTGGATTGSGGRVGSGGAGVGGSTGTAGGGGPSLCAPGRYAICEGFEATTAGTNVAPAGWTRTGAVDVIADAPNVYRGQHALRINPVVSGPRRINKTSADFTALGGSFWGRIFYKVQSPAPISCQVGNTVLHATFVALQGVGPAGGAGEFRVVDTVEDAQRRHQFIYNIQYATREVGRGSAYSYMFDGNWHCAEWQIDDVTPAYHVYLDGTEVALTGSAALDVPPVFSELRVGVNNYQAACTPYLTAWIDEIALDKNRIGCGN